MFVDVVGSTAMAERHEPEVVRDVLREYQDVCERAITAHHGYIFRYLGDGIMVYFGFPSAREDDARQAVLAGLEIMDALAAVAPRVHQQHGVDLVARVGIHTGLVLMSDMGSGPAREPDAAIGPAPNEAARLQGLAPPGGVVISDDTYEIVRGYFEVEPLGTPAMKGIERPVAVYQVLRRTDAVQRLQAAAVRTPLVGRHDERRVLREAWDALLDSPATGSRVHTITLRGEAGIGKSRLADTLAADALSSGGTVLSAFCASDRQASRFFPVVGMLERTFELTADDDATTRTARIEAACGSSGLDVGSAVPFVIDVLGLPADARSELPDLDPHRIRERTFDALTDVVRALARRGRVLLLVDDVQWADQTTLEWLTRLASLESTLPLLMLAVARPEFEPPWTGPTCRTIEIGRMLAPDHRELIRELAGRYDIPESVWAAIADRSDGNPLFTEEIARSIGEGADGYRGVDTIPRTIRDLLTARLDALGDEKALAQAASVIGREIDADLLSRVTGRPRKQVIAGLTELARAAVIEPDSESPRPDDYRFVHALVRNAAYESQEQGQARAVHGLVAHALASRPGADPGVVAQHFDAAAVPDQAVTWYLLAGAAAQETAADAEAIRYLDRGLELLPGLPADPSRDVLEFNLHLARGTSYVSREGYSAPRAVEDFRRSLELSEEVATGIDALPPTAAIWAYYLVHGDLRSAADAVERLRAMSRPELEAEVLCCEGVQRSFEGRFRESLEILARSVAAFDARPPRGSGTRWLLPNDSHAVALTHLGIVHGLIGETEQARRHLDQAMRVAQSLANYPTGAFTVAYVASYSGLLASFSRRYDEARVTNEHVLAVAERFGMQFWLSTATAGRAIAIGHLGDPRTALDMLTPALAQWQSLGAGALVPFDTTERGYLHLQLGELADALADVDAALALAEHTTEHMFTAETRRVRAAVLLALDPVDVPAVRAELVAARTLAAAQGALLFELRSAIDLLALPGTRDPADVAALQEILGRVPAEADYPELARARELVG